jgi:hypothetical protein
MTLAHEAFHVLENIAISRAQANAGLDPTHYPYTPLRAGEFEWIHTINLMAPALPPYPTPNVFDSIRLDEGQQTRSHARTLLVKDPA